MINIYYLNIEQEIEDSILNSYLEVIPSALQNKVLKYRRWQDRYTNLFGKLILLFGLKHKGYNADCLKDLKYNEYGKPFLDNRIHFNLSHSGTTVICALSGQTEIGIDIEEKKTIDIHEFDNIFTSEELDIMQNSADRIHTFYKYWTIKESVIKAIGKGLSIPLREVIVMNDDNCRFRDLSFNISMLNIRPGYTCSLARLNNEDYTIQRIELPDLDVV